MEMLKKSNPSKNENWVSKEHNQCFIKWLKHHIDEELNINVDSVFERLKWLTNCPSIHVLSYSGYLINGFRFYMEEQDNQSKMQNSGVIIVARTLHMSSAKDRKPIYANMSYFGVIKKYGNWITQCFGCRFFVVWELITIMAFEPGYKDEPFILASHAQQVFYVSDPTNKKLFIVLLTNKIILNSIGDQEDIDVEDDLF
ncbi:hypothetical protein Lal_00031337 [Lupinus albus]|nr:hypothetical protein Lal_00031337 [Lupinus albus]